MEPKANSYEEAAIECAAALSQDDIENLHFNISYVHFGYGLYLRNRYAYLLKKARTEMK